MCPFFARFGQYGSHALAGLKFALFHVKTRLLVSIFTCFFLLVNFIDGYVRNVTAISPSRDRNRKYFQFTLQGKEEEKRVVSFSPELLLKIQNKQTDCEIKKFRLNDKNEIIVGDYTSVRETEPMFERKEEERSFVSVVYINNEAQLYAVVNATGLVCKMSPIETVETSEKAIRLRKATLKDNSENLVYKTWSSIIYYPKKEIFVHGQRSHNGVF